jgi:hypothetical protein
MRATKRSVSREIGAALAFKLLALTADHHADEGAAA